jgi:hypothetical protein
MLQITKLHVGYLLNIKNIMFVDISYLHFFYFLSDEKQQ